MACWNKTKVHVAGVPLSSVRRETVGLVVSSFLSVATVYVDVGDGKQKGKRHSLCFSGLASERRVSRVLYGSSSPVGVEAGRSPCSCSGRRSKQVNLVYDRRL